MKLYEVYMNNNLDYGDNDGQTKLIVAKDMSEATIKAEKLTKETYDNGYNKPYYYVDEVSEVDGYKIEVMGELI